MGSSFDLDGWLLHGLRWQTAKHRKRNILPTWKPGKPFRLFLCGYNGHRNTGSDMRVGEMIKQFQHLLKHVDAEITVSTFNPKLTKGYFTGATQKHLHRVGFVWELPNCVDNADAVVACEGSMFKSKWANALTGMMSYALGLAKAEKKPAIGYGAEAGHMVPMLEEAVGDLCTDSLIICRNPESREILHPFGLRTTLGSDTAWTFAPDRPERAEELLRAQGWDGKQEVISLCVIDPFCWPVKPSFSKLLAMKTLGLHKEQWLRSIYFFQHNKNNRKQFATYVKSFATGVKDFIKEKNLFPVVIGMEQLDRQACELFAQEIGAAATLISDQHDMHDLVSVLRASRLVVSSRYHAIVGSMPAGTPSIGVSMDERIDNIMTQRGHQRYCLQVDDPELANKLPVALEQLWNEHNELREAIEHCCIENLKLMGQMGIDFLDEISRAYPDFPRPLPKDSWEAHLPALNPRLQNLIDKRSAAHGTST